jgi:AcrR family transcriptional regulator
MATTTRPRPARKQRATRPMILDAARRIARADGWPAVTIRRVADDLGYTSPLIYEHFRDKGDALAAILHEGFGALAADMAAAAARPVDPADPDAYALGVAEAYLAFARRDPAVYQLMNGMGGVSLDPAETVRGAHLTCEVGVGALESWAQAAGVRFPDALAATEVLWCALHGVTCLAIAGRLDAAHQSGPAGGAPAEDAPADDAHADALLRRATHTLLAGWRAAHG